MDEGKKLPTAKGIDLVKPEVKPQPGFKYAAQLKKLRCGVKRFSELDRKAHRWFHLPIETDRNHCPQAINNPRKKAECLAWALSCFDTFEQANSSYKYHVGAKPQLAKFFGTHIVETNLVKADGVSEDSQENGHYNFHEYKDYTIIGRIVAIKPVEL